MQNKSPTIAPWQGSLNLRYIAKGGQTQVDYAEAKAPFKVQRPFYPEGDAVCHSVILHTAGGMVSGDRLSLDLHLASGSHALVTTAAASKIYRSKGETAHQTIRIKVEEGARLEWLPQEAIAFHGADYHQTVQIELAPTASVMFWDVMRFGRSASGEKFLQGQVRSQTEVWQAGKPLWIDRQRLEGGEAFLQSSNAFAGYPVLASFACLGLEVTPDLIQKIRGLEEFQEPIQRQNQSQPCDRGMTRLQSGLLCRYRGSSSHQARQWFIAIWDLMRREFYQRSACLPRVWPSS